jgi:putative ABC transport system permease protein
MYVPIAQTQPFLLELESDVQVNLQLTTHGVSATLLSSFLTGQDKLAGRSTTWSVDRTDTLSKLEAELEATRSTFQIVALLGLLSAILAIVNVGLSALKERSSEFSLRRALGASRHQIAAIVLLESQLIALGAGVVAVPLCYVVYPLIASEFSAPYGVPIPEFSFAYAWIGVIIGMASALAGSMPAAIRSTFVPISTIMRE